MAALLTLAATPRFQPQVILQDAAGKKVPRKILLPYANSEQKPYELAYYTLTFSYSANIPSDFHIIPDDCVLRLWLNDTAVDLKDIPARSRCDYQNGFQIDLAPYLKPEGNKMVVEVKNKSSLYGLQVSPVYSAATGLPVALLLMGAGLCFLYGLAQIMRFDRLTTFIWCASLPYFGSWLYGTSPLHYMHDIHGHLAYLRHLLFNWDAPYWFAGHERWQPPTYYYALAAIQKLAGHDEFVTIRLFSLFLYQLFCFFGIRTLREAISTRGPAYYVGVMLIVFWPVSVQLATRINNDIPLYATWAASFYYLTRWHRTQEMAALRTMAMWLALGLTIKSNALIPLAIAVLVWLYALKAGRTTLRGLFVWPNLPSVLLLVLGALVNTGRHWYSMPTNRKSIIHLHFGQDGTASPSWQHFTSFDLSYYLEHPFSTIAREPSFANNFLKTMLFGEFNFGQPEIATILGIFLLLFLAIFMASSLARIRQWKNIAGDALPYLCGTIVPVLSVMAFFAIKKMEVCQEFRFAVPMIIPLAILYVSNLNALKQQSSLPVLYWLGLGTGAALPVGGVLFYLAQYF